MVNVQNKKVKRRKRRRHLEQIRGTWNRAAVAGVAVARTGRNLQLQRPAEVLNYSHRI